MTIGKFSRTGALLLTVAGTIVFIHLFAQSQPGKAAAIPPQNPAAKQTNEHAVNVEYDKIQWTAMVPEMGENSPMRAVLHEHPVTHSSQFLIRMPPNFHVPAHYHTVNETHTVIEGTFIVQVDGKRTPLKAGGFNYTPARMVHEAWTPKDQGALIFVTVDGGYDLFPVSSPAPPNAGR